MIQLNQVFKMCKRRRKRLRFGEIQKTGKPHCWTIPCGGVTYGELKQRLIDVGRHLSVRQLVVIEMGNNIESVVFYLGCLFKGTVAILVHENLSEFELSEYIEKFQPEYLFLLI